MFCIEFVFTFIELLVDMCKLSIDTRDDVYTDGFVNGEFAPIQFN